MEREAAAHAGVVGMVGAIVGEACNAAAARSPRGVFGMHVPTDALVVKEGRHATQPFVNGPACGCCQCAPRGHPATSKDVARILAIWSYSRKNTVINDRGP